MKELTSYPSVNVILGELLTAVTPILGDQFIGLYLTGSLALGDFNPNRSDIDFVAATAVDLPDETVAALAAMHARLRASGRKWATKIEGDYIPLATLRRYDPANVSYPHLGDDGHFAVELHGSDMIIQFHTLREKGVALAGPPPHTLIDPIPSDDLRRAASGVLKGWWQPMLDSPYRLPESGYQVYAILTMCRMLYTIRLGGVISKPAAAKWALDVVDGRFHPLIRQANTWQNGMPFDRLAETLDFISYVLQVGA